MTEKENEKAIKALEKGLPRAWDLFLYGDREKGIKPGRIETYGTIVGMREVRKNRLSLREELARQQEE